MEKSMEIKVLNAQLKEQACDVLVVGFGKKPKPQAV